MRVKKPYQILTFYTTSAAMAMERYCAEHEIPGRLIPIPRELSAGCGLAWRMETEAYIQYQEELLHTEIEIQQNAEVVIWQYEHR